MTWARKRQIAIIGSFIALVLVVMGGFSFYALYKPASCIDGKQNQDETGIDCGGRCSTVCSSGAYAAVVRFARIVNPSEGRNDLIVYIDNPNQNAQVKGAKFDVVLYSATRVRVGGGTIAVDLPVHSTVPVYIANIAQGDATQAFVTSASTNPLFVRAASPTLAPTVQDVVLTQSAAPRVTATLVNPLPQLLHNITVIATVFDAQNNAVGATQTFVVDLPSQGTAPLIFTWNSAFTTPGVRAEVIPVPTL